MGKTFDRIDDGIAEFICAQHVFFVATAPLSAHGHVNLSPKGLDSFRILDPFTVAYLDLTGSGIETLAHVKENGRLTIMFCAFSGPPQIVRIQGRAETIERDDAEFTALSQRFPEHPGARAVIRLAVTRVATSCGYSVPRYDYVGDRDVLTRWAENKGDDGLVAYRREKNHASIDGLPGLDDDRR